MANLGIGVFITGSFGDGSELDEVIIIENYSLGSGVFVANSFGDGSELDEVIIMNDNSILPTSPSLRPKFGKKFKAPESATQNELIVKEGN
jgi:hypothetical protein